MRHRWWIIAGILLMVFVYLNAIWYRPLFPTDEPRYGEIAREMLLSGDWVTPRLAGLRYFEKPVLTHWLNAASLWTFGENPFAVRFASSLAGLLTAAFLWLWLKMALPERKLGMWAALVYLTSVLPFAISTWAVTDSILTMFVTGCLGCFYLSTMRTGVGRQGWLALAGAFAGAAFLTKGLPGLAIPGMAAAGFLLWERQWKQLASSWIVPLLVCGCTVAPWAVQIHRAQPDFWNYFIMEEHVARFLNPERGDQHEEGFWFFLPVLLGGMLPWTLFWPLLWKQVRALWQEKLIRFALIGSTLVFVFMSASGGKLAPYILPIFPLLATVTAAALLLYFQQGNEIGFRRIVRPFGWVLVGGSAGFALYQLLGSVGILPEKAVLYGRGEWSWVAAVAATSGWGLAAWASARVSCGKARLMLWGAGTLAALAVMHFVIPQRFSLPLSPEVFYRRFADRVTPETILVGRNEQIAALCWSFKRTDVLIYEMHEELRYGASYADAGKRALTPEEFVALTQSAPGKVVIALSSKRVRKLLPPSKFTVWENKLLYQEYDESDR